MYKFKLTKPVVIALNGPPRSGKDTLGKMCVEHLGAERWSYADIVKIMTHRALIRNEYLDKLDVNDPNLFEHSKDIQNNFLNGITPRTAYINFSEMFMKPTFGQSIWADMLVKNLMSDIVDNYDNKIYVITDVGFDIELEVLIKQQYAFDTLLVHLMRNETNFEKDSRNYVKNISGTKDFFGIYNSGTIDESFKIIVERLRSHYEQIA